MINIKYFLLPATVLVLFVSGATMAKQPNSHGNNHNKGSEPDARLLNNNTGGNLRGRDRADERHDINESREHDNDRNDDRRSNDPRYNQYNQQNPVDTIIDRAIDNVDQKARNLTGGQPRYRR